MAVEIVAKFDAMVTPMDVEAGLPFTYEETNGALASEPAFL